MPLKGGTDRANRRFKFHKRSQLFFSVHDKGFSVVAMRVRNPDLSPVGINRRDTAPTPTGFGEIVGDLRIVDHVRRRPARFNLCAHFLQARSKRFNSLLLARNARLQFLDFAMLFEKLVEQHCVHRIVTNA
jgi:hypothetical protein